MTLLLAAAIIVVLLFGAVVFFGAPYVPTLSRQTETALDLLDLKPGQTLLELGSGDGRVMAAAAARGINVVGYELNPLLVMSAWWRTRRYRPLVRLRWANFWRASWPPADGIFVFLHPRFMSRLDKKIVQSYGQKCKLVSFAFEIPGKRPAAEKDGVYLYKYHVS